MVRLVKHPEHDAALDAKRARHALMLVRHAVAQLRKAGAVKAAARVASVVHSVEGAARHAALRARRAQAAQDLEDSHGL